MKFHDYYKTLHVERSATQDEIHKAYRRLARKYHPDISKEKDAEARFKEIVEAYEVLKDEDKRKRYDTLGASWKQGQDFQPPPGWEGTRPDFGGAGEGDDGGFSDFFQNLFGGAAGMGDFAGRFRRSGRARAQRAQPQPEKGSSHEVELEVTLEEAFRGATKRFDLHVTETLANGEVHRTKRSYDVRIPPGTTSGKRIRLAGQGGPGRAGGDKGDLILRVRLAPHDRFQVEGHDLVTPLLLAPWEAALGARVAVRTLDGEVELNVAAGTQTGQRLRIRSHGLPTGQGDQRGHLLAEAKIVVPRELSAEERRLWQEMAKASPFQPRG